MKKVLCKDYDGYRLFLEKGQYSSNKRLYLGLLYWEDEEQDYRLWDDLTINLNGLDIESDNVVFINNDIEESILKQLEDIGLLFYLDTVQYNYGNYKKYYVSMKKVEEYESEGGNNE